MSAPTWVFLRGLMRDQRHWGEFPCVFRDLMPDARIECLDFAGNGTRHRERSARTIEAMADDARADLLRRGLKPPYRLLAMSLGAMAATSWADRHPQDIDACVLINTSLRPFSPPHWRLRPKVWPRVLEIALRPPAPRAIEAMILDLTTQLARRPERAPHALLDQWTAWRESDPVSRSNALRQLLAAAAYRAPKRCPDTRVLILNGAKDDLVDSRCSRRLAERWGCPLRVHPEAGHDLPLDDGHWVAASIRNWL